MKPFAWIAILSFVAGCSGPSTGDAGTDTGSADVPAGDSAADGADAGSVDAGSADAGASDAGGGLDADASGNDAGDMGDASAADADAAAPVDAGPGWECLGHVPPSTSNPGTLSFSLNVNDFGDGGNYADATVKACDRADVTCVTPVDMGTTDTNGNVQLSLPLDTTGWFGYFEITGAGIYPTRYFTVVPFTDLDTSSSTAVLSDATFTGSAAALGVDLDPARGHVVGNVFDCELNNQAGIVLALDPHDAGATQFYLENGLPSTSATATDSTGAGGFLNEPEGGVTLTATVGGARIGSVDLSVRAGYVTTFGMRPLP